MGIFYATREQVKTSLEIMNISRSNALVDAKIDAASRSLEGLLHRRFYPERRTVSLDWPNMSGADSWQVWLDGNDLISIEAVVSGGTSINVANVLLRRGDDIAEPPYTSLEISLASNSFFASGTTWQQSLALTGLFGYNATDVSIASASLGATINSSVTTLVLNPSSGIFDVGVGSIGLIGTERVVLTQRRMSDTLVNTSGTLTANQNSVSLAVQDGTQFAVEEVILIESERMRIDDIAGNTLTVSRAWDGSVLAAHASGLDVYALRTFTAQRGALGSTAAAHTLADPCYAHKFPALINELCIAETVVSLEQNAAGYARTVGSGGNLRETGGQGLNDVREMAYQLYGRKLRSGAI